MGFSHGHVRMQSKYFKPLSFLPRLKKKDLLPSENQEMNLKSD